jgi:Amt family ammonium transporter
VPELLSNIAYTDIVSAAILWVVDRVIGLRVSQEQEAEGLDLALHDECGYII